MQSARRGVGAVWCECRCKREREEKREVVEKVRFASGAAQHSKQASTFRSGWLVGKGCDRVRHPPAVRLSGGLAV